MQALKAVLCATLCHERHGDRLQVRPQRAILGTHFWNPPFLIPLVEVVRTADVSDHAVDAVCDVLREAGKKPIVVKKDVPGFIANRMQNALGREAVSIIANGIADPKDVDDAVKYSFGMRLGTIGPIEQIDAIGADLCPSISLICIATWNSRTIAPSEGEGGAGRAGIQDRRRGHADVDGGGNEGL